MADFKNLENQILSGAAVEIPDFISRWLNKTHGCFVAGKWVCEGEKFSTINPATEAKLSEITAADEDLVNSAVESGRAAFEKREWAGMDLARRCDVLKKIGDLILEHRAPLALLETLDTGKPIREAFEGDIARAASNFHFFAAFARNEEPLIFLNGSDTHRAYREPMGVVALITPWNLPLYLATWKIAPALAMGNSVVLKPSELTPLTATYLTELIAPLLPAGVFNLVHGFGEGAAGEFLTRHRGVDAISFTGETGTGRAIMRAASVGPTRVSFELGGKGASIVFADSDQALAAKECTRAAFRNQGEICLASPRVFVEQTVFDDFLGAFLKETSAIQVGNPLQFNTTMGALIGRDHYAKVTGYLKDLQAPVVVHSGGKRPRGMERGYFLEPTVLTGVPLNHRVSCEEIFGPVVSLYPFTRAKEAVDAVNGTEYGLSASVWTRDSDKAKRVARDLRTGLVWVNSWFVRDLRVPFGGQKRSGIGREGGVHSLDFYSEWKSVCYRGVEP